MEVSQGSVRTRSISVPDQSSTVLAELDELRAGSGKASALYALSALEGTKVQLASPALRKVGTAGLMCDSKYTKQNKGHAVSGQIAFIGQTHAMAGVTMNASQKREVLRSQFDVYQELQRKQAKHVFGEGATAEVCWYCESIISGNAGRATSATPVLSGTQLTTMRDRLDRVARALKESNGDFGKFERSLASLGGAEADLFMSVGGAFTYVVANRNQEGTRPRLYVSCSDAYETKRRQFGEVRLVNGVLDEPSRRLVFDDRERDIADQVKRNLPGIDKCESVFVVMGRMHSLHHEFTGPAAPAYYQLKT